MNENQKKRLALSISGYFKKAIKLTAITVTLSVPVALFAQDSGCDSDHDCIIVIGNPPPDPPDPGYDGPTPGCDYAGDSDCNDSGGGSSGGGGGSGPNPWSAQCRALLPLRPNQCIVEPVPPSQFNWEPDRWALYLSMSVDWGAQIEGFTGTQYTNLVAAIGTSFFNTQNFNNVSRIYWQDNVIPYCTANFPARGSALDVFGPLTFDSSDCVEGAYHLFEHISPTFDDVITTGSLSLFGVTISSGSTSGNFGGNFFNRIYRRVECKSWFDQRRAANCIE